MLRNNIIAVNTDLSDRYCYENRITVSAVLTGNKLDVMVILCIKKHNSKKIHVTQYLFEVT